MFAISVGSCMRLLLRRREESTAMPRDWPDVRPCTREMGYAWARSGSRRPEEVYQDDWEPPRLERRERAPDHAPRSEPAPRPPDHLPVGHGEEPHHGVADVPVLVHRRRPDRVASAAPGRPRRGR